MNDPTNKDNPTNPAYERALAGPIAYFDGFWPRRRSPHDAFGLQCEIGPRAYGELQRQNRRR